MVPVKYPKLAAAIDETAANLVRKHGEEAAWFLIELAQGIGMIDGMPTPEKRVDVPVTKEVVLSHQEEVRDAE